MDSKGTVIRMAISRLGRGSALAAGLLLATVGAQAATIELSLGASTQNFLDTGIGPTFDSTGEYANWSFTQGACVGTTALTCTLSGSYAAQSGIAAGTYSFVTTYTGAAPTGVSEVSTGNTDPTKSPNYFYYTSLAANTSMVLTLDPVGSSPLVENLVTAGAIVNPTFFFLYTGAPMACTGITTPCTAFDAGIVPGATYATPVTIGVAITAPVTPVPLPGTLAMMLSGALVLGGFGVLGRKGLLNGAMPTAA
jgi:hypothetical protein